MIPLARGYSYVMYLADAGATYTIPFPYLDKAHMRVYGGDAGDAVEQSFTWTGPTTIQIDGELPKGILVTVRRFTPRDKSLVEYSDSAQLPAEDLNRNAQQLLYIMQEQIDYGTGGGSSLPGGGTGWPNPDGSNPNLTIQQIIDGLMQSPIFALLTSRLDDIDNSAETMLEELLRSDQMFNLRRATDQRVAFVETTIETINDNSQAVAKQITEIYAQFDQSAAQIITVQEALATETLARATAITQVNAAIGENSSAITEMKQAMVTEAEATATAITTVRSDFKAADEANTTAIYQQVAKTYATPTQAQTIASTTVSAFANGAFAGLEERFEAVVKGTADPAGEWSANWSVRINAGPVNGTPVIAGIGLGVDSKTGSNFIVMADRFGIISPTYTTQGGVGQMKYPFVVGTVGGVSTVGITGQLIVDGSVTADKMKVNSLSAITANMGTVNGGTFRTFQLDANGNIINPLEFRCEMTNNPGDAYPMWIGAGVKNWNNAVFAVDRAGNARFAGTVSAGNITDKFQQQSLASWTGDARGSDSPVIMGFGLPAPVRLGETHSPVLMIEMFINGSDDDGQAAAGCTVVIERIVGSTWVPIRSSGYAVYKYTSYASTAIVADAATSVGQNYRVRLVGGSGSGDFHVLSINVYAFGLR